MKRYKRVFNESPAKKVEFLVKVIDKKYHTVISAGMEGRKFMNLVIKFFGLSKNIFLDDAVNKYNAMYNPKGIYAEVILKYK